MTKETKNEKLPGSTAPFGVRLLAAQKLAKQVKPDGKNQAQNYEYTSVQALLRAGKAACEPNDIIINFTSEPVSTEQFKTAKGAVWIREKVSVLCTLVDAHDKSNKMQSVAIGTGVDPGDKAGAKALSMGEKYSLSMALAMPFNADDPEADEKTDKETKGRPVPQRSVSKGQQVSQAARATSNGPQGNAGIEWRWGKHAGSDIGTVPTDYLQWVAYKAERMGEESKGMAITELQRRADVVTGNQPPSVPQDPQQDFYDDAPPLGDDDIPF